MRVAGQITAKVQLFAPEIGRIWRITAKVQLIFDERADFDEISKK